jgi:hypothetical protein
LILLGVMAFVAGVIVHFPAQLAWSMTPRPLQQLVPVESVSGTLWRGTASPALAGQPVQVGWSLGWQGLAWQARAAGLDATGRLAGWPGGDTRLAVDAATVDPSFIKPWLRQQGLADVQGVLLVRGVELHRSQDGALAATGRLAWGPGRVQPVGKAALQVPALSGKLAVEAGVLVLDVESERAPGQALGRLHFDPEAREAGVALRQRALDQLDLPGAGRQSPDSVVFSVRQQLR